MLTTYRDPFFTHIRPHYLSVPFSIMEYASGRLLSASPSEAHLT